MGLFRDRRDRRDLSLKVCWTLAVWLMTQQLRCDVNEADEAEQRRLASRGGCRRGTQSSSARRLYGSKEHLVIDSRIYRELALRHPRGFSCL